jgi:hypothetical protein
MGTKNRDKVLEQAKILARESMKSEPDISKIYWFPDDREAHLILVEENTFTSESGEVQAFYFDASPEDNITVPSGIAIIRPDEIGDLTLPKGWGDWKDGVELDVT